MFPLAVYRQTWERLSTRLSEREACKTIVGLLVLAAEGHEAQLAIELEQLIELDQLPDLLALTALLAPRPGVLPAVTVDLPTLAGLAGHKCILRKFGLVHHDASPTSSEPIPMRKPLTGEPCAGEPLARFGGRGGRCPSLPLSTGGITRGDNRRDHAG